jgi:hypothetical protein
MSAQLFIALLRRKVRRLLGWSGLIEQARTVEPEDVRVKAARDWGVGHYD